MWFDGSKFLVSRDFGAWESKDREPESIVNNQGNPAKV
jgi:hypothetical protein